MTTARRTNQITDEFNRPVPGAQVYVYNVDDSLATLTSDGTIPLANPVITDAFGNYSYYAAVGYYREDVWFNGSKRWSENNVAVGSPGADLALRSDLAATTGSSLINWIGSAVGAVARTLAAKFGLLPLTPEDFGAVGDNVTDDHAALQAWLDSGGLLSLPAKSYYSSATLIVRKHVDVRGKGYGFDARLVNGTATVGYELQPGSRIHFPSGVGGFDIQPQTTVTDVAIAVAAGGAGDTQEGAYHSRIANLALIGAGTGASATGLHSRTRVDLENVHAYKFQGKGFDISASSDVPDGNEYGTASHSTLKGCRAISNGSHGFHVRGRDANVINLESCFSQLNGGWGFLDDSELGNTYVACLAATNTLGSFSASSAVGVQSYFGCYVEAGTGYNCDLNSACQVIGGFLAQCALTNNAANQTAQILASNAAQLNYLKFVQNEENLGALSAQASIYRHADQGLVLQGAPDGGGSFDCMVRNKSDQAVMAVVTGTAVARFFGPIQPFSSYIYYNGSTTNPGIVAGDSVMFSHATNGLTLSGWGSTLDSNLANHSGNPVVGVPTGTNVMSLATNTVSTLPASPPVGSRSFVTDATATTFASSVAGGGANKVPVYFDGAWKIG